jgi:hypothetical protein
MISIGRYRFEGPVYDRTSLKDAAGIYAVLDDRGVGGYHVLDIGESHAIRTRIQNHDREDCWNRNVYGLICFACLYLPGSTQQQRCEIEAELRAIYTPVCGLR